MAEYIIQDSTLTDIADAIRAKDGSSAPILTEDMADAIAAIPTGGGGSLPSVISKIDGGSFTFATDTAVQSNKISHTLGVKPKGYIIWSDDVMRVADNYQNICLMFSYGIGLPWLGSIGGTENQIGYSYAMWRKTNGAVQEQNSGAPKINDTEIAPAGFHYWCGGATYKWLAWA